MEKKDGFVSIVKGVITGIASLIPGMSPASCITSLSSYDKFITGISSIFKKTKNKQETKENKKILLLLVLPIMIGIIIGLIAGDHLVGYFLGKYRVQTMFLFIGLLVGGFILIVKKQKTNISKNNLLVFLISLVLIFTLYFILNKYTITIPKSIIPLAGGILTALTLLVPSISLSYIYNLLDKYDYIVSSALSLSSFKDVLVVLTFVVVFLLSLVLIAKIIFYLFKRFEGKCYAVICSLMILSVVVVILNIGKFTISFVNIFTTILAFLWGYLLAKNIEKE